MAEKVWPGEPYPLGATFDGSGTNFALFAEMAESVVLCLYDDNGHETQVTLPEVTGFNWHGYFPEIGPGQRYGYRVQGPWDPSCGQRCSFSKLLMDPYAKAFEDMPAWNPAILTYDPSDPENSKNEQDSASFIPKAVVINPYFDWSGDHRPKVPLNETIIYETHVKGFSMLNSEISEELRGTYLALADPAAIKYLGELGITTVELMPVHSFVHDQYLVDKGLSNYWGYNSIGYFAPHRGYSTRRELGQEVPEFKQMVRRLHEAGIEVILDVVYNHTAEGNHLGPTLSFKGIDNVAYYHLVPDDLRYYMDYTGTGNTLNMGHPHVLQLVMDSLRYWAVDMHVDGFRFDLASALARELHEVDRLSAFFGIIHQDPVISQVKLIAEPWDVGDGGYQVGKFPVRWSEWNGRYRDSVRDFWRGHDCSIGEFASRLTGSSDLYENTGRRPHASVNFVTAHDGFTLHDLVSYNDKHNEANGEENRDGGNDNRSWNSGAEGDTDDPAVKTLRARRVRDLTATLLLSQGVPMILGGDEIGRTQRGNNNAYCQDNDISWYHWDSVDEEMRDFTRRVIALRKDHPVFHRRHWFQGYRSWGSGHPDINWYRADGNPMTEEDWKSCTKTLQVLLSGDLGFLGDRGGMINDDDFMILFSADDKAASFTLPARDEAWTWINALDTGAPIPPKGEGQRPTYYSGEQVRMEPYSLVVLRHER